MPQNEALTGGCQCGAVRFRVDRAGNSGICHCRMCQKAFGSFFAPFVTGVEMVWTRGAPKLFRSSPTVSRGFCADCGTPLTYQLDGEPVELAVGAFDEPDRVAPKIQVNAEFKRDCFDGLPGLSVRTENSPQWQDFMANMVSFQHPDHDTANWPAAEER